MEVQTQQVAGALYTFATVFEEYHANVDVAATASQADCATIPILTPPPSPSSPRPPSSSSSLSSSQVAGALYAFATVFEEYHATVDQLELLSGDVEGTDCSATPQRS
eukprot:gene21865-28896_t